MPLDEEGAKWSCEPCIRGHRSSKCQHFDRLMMKVPKAGRPLAKCPHPKGSCSCERVYAFMVRIPKGSTCLCRPLYQVPASSAETSSLPSGSATPSTAPTPVAAGRVQKHTRRPSNFQSPSETVIKALDSELLQSDSKDIRLLRQPTSLSNSTAIHNKVQNLTRAPPVSDTKSGSCCAGKSEPVTPAPQQRSCCGGPPAIEEAKSSNAGNSGNAFGSTWTGLNNSESVPWGAQLPNNNYALQNNTYPVIDQRLHSYRNGLQQSQAENQGNMSAASMDQILFNSSTYPFNMTLPFVSETNHDCSCGDSCQCLGCASHPFNETTRQHVQEMGYMMTVKEDEDKSNASSPFAGTKSPAAQLSNTPSNNNLPNSSSIGQTIMDDPTLLAGFDNNALGSPTFASDQFMQPSEYYTLEYPVGINVCSDTTGTCQCGNDCSCVGCITHSGHDGITLESMSAEHPRVAATNEDMTQEFREYFSQSTTEVPRSMDQYSPSALSPPIVETPLG